MTDLATALAAVGERAPESRVDPRCPLVADAMRELDEYRALALRLAVRLAEERGQKQAEGDNQCYACEGWGRSQCDECGSLLDRKCWRCKGTGQEPPR